MNEHVSAPRQQRLTKAVGQVATYYHPRTWKEKGIWWTGALFLVTYVVVVSVLGMIWSRSPATFDVRSNALSMVAGDDSKLVPGVATTSAAIRIAATLLDKPGGYLTNDISPPGIALDNIPNWEFGALTGLRDLTLALRNDFSRTQSQSVADKDLEIAQPQFNYQSDSWILPSTESEYRLGIKGLRGYLNRLSDKIATDGQFFARSDNLRVYLFEARGYTWALLESLQATAIGFESVLQDNNALVSLEQINRELQNTQNSVWRPMILNGTGFGPMANHSLVMASYISRVNAAATDLRKLLLKG